VLCHFAYSNSNSKLLNVVAPIAHLNLKFRVNLCELAICFPHIQRPGQLI
jgi:hypothetical protein